MVTKKASSEKNPNYWASKLGVPRCRRIYLYAVSDLGWRQTMVEIKTAKTHKGKRELEKRAPKLVSTSVVSSSSLGLLVAQNLILHKLSLEFFV